MEVGVFEAPQTQQFAALEVPEGKTLTIAPGAVIKGKESGACAAKDLANPTPCSIFVEGALDAVGTASEPITFTSINDNSVGGITGSGKPAAGDWGGHYAATYWGDTAPTNAGSIDLEHAKVSYAYDGVETYSRGAATVLKSDAFVSSQYAAVTTFGTSPTLEDNSSDDAGKVAFSVWSEALNMNLLGGNSATGGTLPVVQLDGQLGPNSTLPLSRPAWRSASSKRLQTSSSQRSKSLKETLHDRARRGDQGAGGLLFRSLPAYARCSLSVEGALSVVGTEEQPITFTSINDNTIGGTTGSASGGRRLGRDLLEPRLAARPDDYYAPAFGHIGAQTRQTIRPWLPGARQTPPDGPGNTSAASRPT